MPSPLAHGLVGLTVHILAARDREDLRDPRRIAAAIGAAVLPDLDLAFRFLDGRNHHDNETHSLGCAVLAAAASAVLFLLLRLRRPFALALVVGLSWTSHLVLDYLNVDTSPPIGIMALWPLSTAHFKSPVPIFMDIGRTLTWTTVRHDAVAGAWECVVLVPLLLAAWRHKRRRLEESEWHAGSRASP